MRTAPANPAAQEANQETAVATGGTNGRHGMAQAKGSRMSIFSELWAFMKVRKKWWLGPIIVTMLMLSVLIVLTEGSAVAPFIYALF